MVNKKHVPQRMCAGCRAIKPKEDLARFALANGEIKLDLMGKMLGRGVSVCKNLNCLNLAFKKKAIERGLKIKLSEQEKTELQSQFIDILK